MERMSAKTSLQDGLCGILEDWTPPLVPLCLYYYNRRNSSAAFQAFIALARDYAAGRSRGPELLSRSR